MWRGGVHRLQVYKGAETCILRLADQVYSVAMKAIYTLPPRKVPLTTACAQKADMVSDETRGCLLVRDSPPSRLS